MKDSELQFDRKIHVLYSKPCKKQIRRTTCANGSKCDYTVCGDRDPYVREHPEYVDEAGYRRNR